LLVSKNELGKGKSASFDGTDEEWMKILMDALFTQEDDTVQLGAKKKDKITVYQIVGGSSLTCCRSMFNEQKRKKNFLYVSLMRGVRGNEVGKFGTS